MLSLNSSPSISPTVAFYVVRRFEQDLIAQKSCRKQIKTPKILRFTVFLWWRLLDSNQWPPACERIGKTFSGRFRPYPTQKNPRSKLSDHPLPQRVRIFRTALWLFMWSKCFPPDLQIRKEAFFLVCSVTLNEELSNSFSALNLPPQITTP